MTKDDAYTTLLAIVAVCTTDPAQEDCNDRILAAAYAYAAACVAEKEARIAELEAALGPFAALADRKQDDLDDDHLLYATWWDNVNRRQITMGDVRRAAAALGEKAN